MKPKMDLSQQQEAVAWLLKPLQLETKQGFLDKAVAGGLGIWVPRVREKLVAQAELAEKIAADLLESLQGYAQADPAARREKIAEVYQRIEIWKKGGKTHQKKLPVLSVKAPALRQVSKKQLTAPETTETPAPVKTVLPPRTEAYRPDMEVQYVRGVGPQRGRLLAKLEIHTVEDLLRHFPRDWQDRRQFNQVHELAAGQTATVMGTVKLRSTFRIRPGLILTKIVIDDGTGMLTGTWFNQPYMKDRFKDGERVLFFGKTDFYKGWQIANPDFELLDTAEEDFIHLGRIVPVYPATERLSQRVLRSMVYEVLAHMPKAFAELLPAGLVQARGYEPPDQALRNIHFPESPEVLERARQRLIFEELFLQQMAVMRLKERYHEEQGRALTIAGPVLKAFRAGLPFSLTPAQQRAQAQLFKDLQTTRPMHRLLQGDVGSGKTIVAALCLCAAVDSQCQAALMAPTEVLATQHYLTLKKMFAPLGVSVELFTSGLKAKEKREQQARLAAGEIKIAVGTHALLQESVAFHSLGLVVIDEQHRFGVEQRAQLRAKGEQPHVLVMTATPIPRTLALTVYGDLDVTVLDELPPGRIPVQTHWLGRSQARKAYERITQEVAAGRQAYIVFPLIEESEKLDLKSLVKEFDRLSKYIFPDVVLGLLHGRMGTEEKDEVMSAFKRGEIKIMASTTVIEVGVDVPNATVMVIEDADRFGLAQLHQLRGRVGRGRQASECYVIADPKTEDGTARMEIIRKIRDGFKLAEEDLALRGPGEFFGLRQHGLPDLKLAHLVRDADQIEPARQAVLEILEKDPKLSSPEHRALKQGYEKIYGEREKRALAG